MFDAIVLAGGAAARLGGAAKPQVRVGGTTLLDRAVHAVRGAERTVVVGPTQPVVGDVTWAREDPPGGGPVAALAAAVGLINAPAVVVLAADLPWIAPAVDLLLAALPGDGAALLVDSDGRRNHLAATWRTSGLARALARVKDPRGASMRALLGDVPVVEVLDPAGWGRDCDTWADVQAARSAGRPIGIDHLRG